MNEFWWLSVDPGTITGYAAWKEDGAGNSILIHSWEEKYSSELNERMNSVNIEIEKTIQHYKPNAIIVERACGATNGTAQNNQQIGVIRRAAYQNLIPVYEISPLTAKKVMTGNGRAEKKDVQAAVTKRYGEEHAERPNQADAVAVGLAWWETKDQPKKAKKRRKKDDIS